MPSRFLDRAGGAYEASNFCGLRHAIPLEDYQVIKQKPTGIECS